MEKDLPWALINNHLRSESEEMDPKFLEWINESAHNQTIYEELTSLHILANAPQEQFNPDNKRAWSSVKKRIATTKAHTGILETLLKVAATIALIVAGFSLSFFLNYSEQISMTTITSPNGNKTEILLPDSSRVLLNGGTTLVYNNDFLNKRKVEIFGEALFSVRKKGKNEFLVQTSGIDVKVLGTEFNVRSYPNDPEIEISLLEGSIELFKVGKAITKLVPGQIAILDIESRKITYEEGNISKIISWTNDELVFEDQTFEEIASYLERWYGVEIELHEDLKKQHRYTFSVKSETLRELLGLINVITPIAYEIDGKHVKISKKN